MSWWQTAPTLIAACAVFFLPGLAAARAIGLKGLPMWAAAPAITVSLAGVSAVVAGFAGIRWNIVSLLAMTVLTVLVAVLVRLAPRRARGSTEDSTAAGTRRRTLRAVIPSGQPRSIPWVTAAAAVLGLGVAAFILAFRLVHMFGAPENISQTYDNIFHLNAIRYAFDTGNASSLLISGMTSSETPPTFYPAAWHDMVVLLMQLTGAGLPVAVNICNIVIAALMWPLGAMFLASRVLGTRPIPLIVTGVLATGFAAFPYLMLDFGVLFPYALSLAVLPVALGLVVSLMRQDADGSPRGWVAAVALIGVIPGMALAHPSSVVSLLGMAAPAAVYALVHAGKVLHRAGRAPAWYLVPAGGIIVYAALVYFAWTYLRPLEEASFWGPFETQAQAIGEALANAPQGRPIGWFVLICTIVGIAVCVRRRTYQWALGSFLVVGALFVVVASSPIGDFRWAVVGVWYNDSYRLASLLPIPAIAVAAVGCTALVQWLADRVKHVVAGRTAVLAGTARYSVAAAAVLGVAGAAVLSWLVQGQNITSAQVRGSESYILREDGALLSTDEQALLERVDDQVPEDATVVGSPWTGASLVYALADRKALTPFVYGDLSGAAQELLKELNDDEPLSADICDEAASLNSYYVLDFGSREVHGGNHALGPENVGNREGFDLIDSEGDAKLYRISVCG
ncbi:hypothetical protein LJ754_00890 [Arthrobacter sp. zg-Y40]|uniref:DUF6541 family protein n=1 Tax=Arthrobacter sp. zg-Y40 TaxID=2886939 RepID=UPI001D13D585|nr:DUF6541 family protein [Arthrobacter sp. zg-Y40]MCC3277720.1 hypothetical protein [Arthrobacter sp. zg-Y40]